MKRIFLYILTIFSFTQSVSAQKIAIDEENINGKFIATDFIPVFKNENGSKGSVSLGVAYNTAMQTLFCINLRIENEPDIKISKGSSLQMITDEGEVIVVNNTSDISTDENILVVSYGVQYNEIELADLDKIMNERIVKLKIETDNGIMERNISNNSFSKAVYSDFMTLKAYLEKQKDE